MKKPKIYAQVSRYEMVTILFCLQLGVIVVLRQYIDPLYSDNYRYIYAKRWIMVKRKVFKSEKIITKQREVDVLLSQASPCVP